MTEGRTLVGAFHPRYKGLRKLTAPLGVLRRLLKTLREQGVITEDLHLPEDWDDLELVYRGLCRKDDKSPRRRIGAFRAACCIYHGLTVVRRFLDCAV